MSHLTPEILRAAALRLWDGESDCVRMSIAVGESDAVRLVGGDAAFDEFYWLVVGILAPSSASFYAKPVTVRQAIRFDFLNLLACSLES